jgi:uncharacterized protein YecE (DUF72 family)
LKSFGGEIAGLGDRRGPVLVQLPPSLAFDAATATAFFTAAIAILGGPIVCEPRHASWFADDADALLRRLGIARVAADPAPVPPAGRPGGGPGLAYVRLHGSPRTYWSRYDEAALAAWASRIAVLCRDGVETWVIFDNTAGGAAAGNALEFKGFGTG